MTIMRSIGTSLASGMSLALLAACATGIPASGPGLSTFTYQGNPLVRDRHTADPAPLVVGDTLYLYVGQIGRASCRERV